MVVANDILIPELGRLLNEEKEVRFTPSGVSMRPFIEGDQDSVVLCALTRAPRRGDILLARVTTAGGRSSYVLHRLVRIEQNEQGQTNYILQGDGNLAGEEHCEREEIIAQVIHIEHPKGCRKPLTRGYLWHALLPVRKWLLKIYRHTILIWFYENNRRISPA